MPERRVPRPSSEVALDRVRRALGLDPGASADELVAAIAHLRSGASWAQIEVERAARARAEHRTLAIEESMRVELAFLRGWGYRIGRA